MKTSTYLLALSFVLAVPKTVAASPKIGEKAPAVTVAEWITEKPPALPGDKGADQHVFLVEFWATWCPPCLKSIPHLAELQKKHRKAGLLILGISNEEPATIKGFIKSKMKMPYFVGQDDDMKTTSVWTDDIQTIPHAFLVNKSGAVVWNGNPLDMDVMDKVIEQVLAGKYDLEAAKNTAATEEKFKTLLMELNAARATHDEKEIFKVLDRMIALRPHELHPYLIKRESLREFNREGEIAEMEAKIEAAFRDDASSLRFLVQIEQNKDLTERNPGLMLRCVVRANELAQGRDPDTLAALAYVQCELGMVDAAIQSQTQAVALGAKDTLPQYKKTLDYYKAVKALRTEHLRSMAASGDDGPAG
jgi:thiol-disulfide isomerase/thioredoxin